jgi:hypothetical protein
MNKHDKMYIEIEKHGQNLNNIFHTKYGNIDLCKKLFRLEKKAHKLAEDYCNGENGVTTDTWEDKCKPILDKVNKLLDNEKINIVVHVNGDARGYALKIREKEVKEKGLKIYTDWGGYGILAPNFRD